MNDKDICHTPIWGKVGQYYLTSSNKIQVFDINVPANPGNSGSPVLIDRAQAVGICLCHQPNKNQR